MDGEKIKGALLERALGYDADEVVEEYGFSEGEAVLVKRKVTKKRVPPDIQAAKMLLERFNYLNHEHNATIIMVTHDSFTASYASRVIFIKDGKIFNEISRGADSRKQFFDKIINVVTLLGGDVSDAL